MTGMESKFQLALLCSGGQAGGGARSLRQHHNYRSLSYASQGKPFYHQGDPDAMTRCLKREVAYVREAVAEAERGQEG